MLKSSLRKLFSGLEYLDGAVIVLIFLYLVVLVSSSGTFPYYERFSLRWQVLYLTSLIATSILMARRGIMIQFFDWFLTLLPLFFFCLFSLWLLVLGFYHGFSGVHLEGIGSAMFFMLSSFVGWFVVARCNPKIYIYMTGACLILTLLLENIFLTTYHLQGYDFNLTFLNRDNLPRIFMNIRHGNSLSVLCSCFSLYFAYRVLRRHNSVPRFPGWFLAFVGFTSIFYNLLLTQGRGLALALVAALVAFLIAFRLRAKELVDLSSLMIFSSGFALILWHSVVWVRIFSLSGAARPFASLVENSVTRLDGGRFQLWGGWISSYRSGSLFFGRGLGVLPSHEFLGNLISPFRHAHSMIIELVHASGIFGVIIFSAEVFVGLWHVSKVWSAERKSFLTVVVAALGTYSLVGGLVYWPTGVWLLGISTLLFVPNHQWRSAPHAQGEISRRISLFYLLSFVSIIIIVVLVIFLSIRKKIFI